ncbi:MAG: hypothetical protein P8J27_01370 [Mariniblastus sp.]|nr:hypothetical protein [Mariniblastus sp.]
MKQELTFATMLLAIGCLLWGPSLLSNFQSETGEKLDVLTKIEGQAAVDQPDAKIDPKVIDASFQSDIVSGVTEKTDSVSKPNSASEQKSELTTRPIEFDRLSKLSHPQSMQLLETAANQLAKSEPLGLKIQLNALLFGQQIEASGRYFQMGQGTHKTRIELSFDSVSQQPGLLQVCDGRFLYTVHSAGSGQSAEQSFEFVDLERVQQAAGEKGSTITPTGWVATGGLASLLQHLASAFNFGAPETLSGDLILVRGGWNEIALRTIVANADNNLDLGNPIRWDRVPRQLPHAVELVFKPIGNQRYIPTQVSYLRFEQTKEQVQVKPTFEMSFSDLQFLDNLAEGFFVVDSTNVASTDKTSEHIDRIDSYRETKQAEFEASTMDR